MWICIEFHQKILGLAQIHTKGDPALHPLKILNWQGAVGVSDMEKISKAGHLPLEKFEALYASRSENLQMCILVKDFFKKN